MNMLVWLARPSHLDARGVLAIRLDGLASQTMNMYDVCGHCPPVNLVPQDMLVQVQESICSLYQSQNPWLLYAVIYSTNTIRVHDIIYTYGYIKPIFTVQNPCTV